MEACSCVHLIACVWWCFFFYFFGCERVLMYSVGAAVQQRCSPLASHAPMFPALVLHEPLHPVAAVGSRRGTRVLMASPFSDAVMLPLPLLSSAGLKMAQTRSPVSTQTGNPPQQVLGTCPFQVSTFAHGLRAWFQTRLFQVCSHHLCCWPRT